ncbi:MAG: gliding motility-associated C-terminal domain-containing protein [Crocinitomicaceae bacterium]|nr:gliding motility-associated C-terminal domain-containing protein [Crocinitomicaceae bacterium]
MGYIIGINCVALAQPANDDCSSAEQLCVDQVITGSTASATSNSSEDNAFCTTNSATVWYTFTTNSTGGNVSVDITNLSFNPDVSYGQSIDAVIFSASTPCDQTTYTPVSNCFNGSSDFSVPSAIALNPNTTYYVMINGTNSGAGVTNSAEADFDITVSGAGVSSSYPTGSISAADTSLCQGDSVEIITTVANCSSSLTYNWYYNNALFSSGTTSDINTGDFNNSGWLKLLVNCGDACVYTDTTDSIYFDVTAIAADAGPDKFIQDGDVVTLEGSGSGVPFWTPGTSLTDPNIFQPSANPTSNTTYFLTVTNGSCVATDSVNVFVGEVVIIFSAFSPNGDDINDKWVIKNASNYPDMEVTIYDRSGQRVFNTTGYSTQDKWWDGTYKGKPLPVSTYYYVVDLKIGEDGIFKGHVSIIK